MKNNLDINKITAEVITDLAKSTAQTLYKKTLIELNRCAMACEGCGAVFSLT